LLITENTCFLKRGKQFIARIDVSDMCTNGRLDLGQVLPKTSKRSRYTQDQPTQIGTEQKYT